MPDQLRPRLSRRTLLASLAVDTVALGSGCAAGRGGAVNAVDPQEFVNELLIRRWRSRP